MSGIFVDQFGCDRTGIVGAAIVDNDYFPIGENLGDDAGDGIWKKFSFV